MHLCALSFGQKYQIVPNNKQALKLLEKSPYSYSKNNCGQHISIREPLPGGDIGERLDLGDDREIIGKLNFTKIMKIELLKEFLQFKGDTTRSNKYYFMKIKRPNSNNYTTRWTIPNVKGFTIEIEALFSFTWILTKNTPPIQPILIERMTGKQINFDRVKVNEVYDIFRKWIEANEKTDFENFKLPLEGTPYHWLGDDVDLSPYLKNRL